MPSTTTTYGADFSYQVQINGILGYINGGDYTEEQTEKLSNALMDALQDKVNEHLGDDITWLPQTSEFIHEVGEELPEKEEMAELFENAWTAVEARYEAIETEVLA